MPIPYNTPSKGGVEGTGGPQGLHEILLRLLDLEQESEVHRLIGTFTPTRNDLRKGSVFGGAKEKRPGNMLHRSRSGVETRKNGNNDNNSFLEKVHIIQSFSCL